MNTIVYKIDEIDERVWLKDAGKVLADGGLVGIPTETVYGLAANALDEAAAAKIYAAKGRPSDNPLIVHIAGMEMIHDLVSELPETAKQLAEKFWPGPLTMVLPKSEKVPYGTTGGLDTVAIRMPSHPVARSIIKAAGVPLAAPSANTSGLPSPTTAAHVAEDMDGKIDAIVDGGPCSVGVESTVVTLCTETPRILRPGGVTPEMLEEVLGDVDIDQAVLGKLKEGERAASPGMKYKHYSPKAEVYIVRGSLSQFAEFVNAKDPETTCALVFDGEEESIRCKTLPFGAEGDESAQANRLFYDLRTCDDLGIKNIYVRCPSSEGVGLAVMNRLLRAAEYRFIDL